MSASLKTKRRRSVASLAAVCCTLAATAALNGQTAEPQAATSAGVPTAPTANVTINLIRLMVEQKLLPAEAAAKLIAQAEAEAAQVSAALAAKTTSPSAPVAAASAEKNAPDTVRVTYIPPHIRRQMVEEVRQEVFSQAVEEKWAAPDTQPEWVSRYKLAGDIRFRYEGLSYPTGNVAGGIVDFNKINTSAAVDYFSSTSTANLPSFNADQERERMRFRARLGAAIDLSEGYTSGLRVATGESNSPVSQNQSFGASGGNFSKYSIWLDRAFLKYESSPSANYNLEATVGRMDNPFFATSMIWANDLGFDGLVLKNTYKLNDNVKPFFTLGAFPVFNTNLNFGTDSTASSGGGNAYASEDKWLYGAQTGATWIINKDFTAKSGIAFYSFQNIEGQVSSPIDASSNTFNSGFVGETDNSRPGFAQKGNTYSALRELTNSTLPGSANFQYFGLATPFRELAFTNRIDYNHFEPIQISLIGEVVVNTAFSRSAVRSSGPTQKPGPLNNNSASDKYEGGNLGWDLGLQVGKAALQKRGDWNVNIGYRYIESDAVVDGFADSDFGGGGTNLQGYTLGGNLSLSSRVWVGLRWMSAETIAGDTFKTDIFQFDLNARF